METKDIIRQLRIDSGLTQQELANVLHFSVSTINKWENGKKDLSIQSVKILARYFEVTTDYILCMDKFRSMT